MMPDLGKYAVEVLSAYGASLAILSATVLLSFMQGRKARRALRDIEARQNRNG